MKFSTAVLTAPRPQSTLYRTLDSLKAGGFESILIYDGSPPPGEKPSPKWCTAAYKTLFRNTLERLPAEAEGLLVFEDDVICCRFLREYLESLVWPEAYEKIAAVSPYCHTAYSNNSPPDKWHREDSRETIAGTQAFLYTRHTMEALADWLDPDHVGVDHKLGQYAKLAGKHLWFHKPSLLQHCGICNSAVGFTSDLGTIYSAETFVGEEFNALELL